MSGIFAAGADGGEVRHRSDAVLVAGGIIGLAAAGAVAVPPSGLEASIGVLGGLVPSGARLLAGSAYLVLAGWIVVVLVASALGCRLRLLAGIVLAVLLAELVAFGAIGIVDWTEIPDGLGRWWSTAPVVSGLLAVVLASAPYLAAPARRWGRSLVAVLLVTTAVAGTARSSELAAAFFAAVIGAASTRLLLGAPRNAPDPGLLLDTVRQLGVDAVSIGALEWLPRAGRHRGVLPLTDGSHAVVLVHGRDAHDAQLVSRLWRAAWYRERGIGLTVGRRHQAEHAALLHLLAHQAGARVPRILAVGSTPRGDAVLVIEASPPRWADVPVDLHPRHADAAWRELERLHRAGISHGDLDRTQLTFAGDDVGFADLSDGRIQPTEAQVLLDRAQLLIELAMSFDPQTAATSARHTLSDEQAATLVRFVQPAACTADQRQRLHDESVLDALRDRLVEEFELDEPELERLRRVTVGSVVRLVLPLLAFGLLYRSFSTIDADDLRTAFADASWWVLFAAFVLAQLPRLAQALSTRGAAPLPLPYGPLYALQLALSYIGVAIPSSAARIAVNLRFMQRLGLSPGSALTAGALDSVAGFLAQLLLLSGALLANGVPELDLDSPPTVPLGKIVLGLIVLGVALGVAALVMPDRRAQAVTWVRQIVLDARDTVAGLRSPRRLIQLLGGNLLAELLFALALATVLLAMGSPLPLSTVILVNIGVSIFAGLLPVPGGIGVTESALTFGFVVAGVPQELAFGTALIYRVFTFYLPPIWGFFAFRWLERQRYL